MELKTIFFPGRIEFRNTAFQYTNNVSIKFKIYKTFISPFIDLYTPIVVQAKELEDTIVHKLQRTTLNAVLDLPRTANSKKVREILGEKTVEEKAQRMATRIINNLNLERPNFSDPSLGVVAGRATNPTLKVDRDDYIFRLFHMAERKIEKVEPRKFETKRVLTQANSIRKEIKNIIKRKSANQD